MRNRDEDVDAIMRAFDVSRHYELERILIALCFNDHDTIAEFRLTRKKAESQASSLIDQYDLADTDESRLQILGMCQIPNDLKQHTDEEILAEKALMFQDQASPL